MSMLWDLISLWTIPWRWRYEMTEIICRAIFLRSASLKLVFFLWSKSKSVPSLTSSITRHSWGGFEMAPNINTMLGCLYLASMFTSLLNSQRSCQLMLGLNTFLMATSTSKYLPLWMVLNPPIEIYSPIYKSVMRMVSTPLMDSRQGYTSCVYNLFCLNLRVAVVSLQSCLNPPVYHPISLSSFFSIFFSSTSQLGVSDAFLELEVDFEKLTPSKQLLSASCRLSVNFRLSRFQNFLFRGLPLRVRVDRKGICEIYSGSSVRALLSRLRTLSRSSSLISGQMTVILLSERLSYSSVRMVKTSLGMKESCLLERSRSFLLLRLACLRKTDNYVIVCIQQRLTRFDNLSSVSIISFAVMSGSSMVGREMDVQRASIVNNKQEVCIDREVDDTLLATIQFYSSLADSLSMNQQHSRRQQ